MDTVQIKKGDENDQANVDACLQRLRQMMLDSDNAWEFNMQGTGTGTAVATIVVGPKNPPKPQTEFEPKIVVNGPGEPVATEVIPAFGVLAVNEITTEEAPEFEPVALVDGEIKPIAELKYDPTKGDFSSVAELAPGEVSISPDEAKSFVYRGVKAHEVTGPITTEESPVVLDDVLPPPGEGDPETEPKPPAAE